MQILTSLLTAILLAGSTFVPSSQTPPLHASKSPIVKGQSVELNLGLILLAKASNANTTNYAAGGRTATVFDPPSNVRDQPNGNIVCTITTRRQINVYRFYDSSEQWLSTDACGSNQYGVIHISQIRF